MCTSMSTTRSSLRGVQIGLRNGEPLSARPALEAALRINPSAHPSAHRCRGAASRARRSASSNPDHRSSGWVSPAASPVAELLGREIAELALFP
jgi:hypothetical protein